MGYRYRCRICTCILGELKMRNVFYCIKEMAIMFALVSMVMAAAVGGACLLLHTL